MVCRVRYLSSTGIHRREIPGVDALSRAYSADWLLYASLQCFPRGELPIEMDAMIVMSDRVLILELKDFNGKLTHNGDQWILNRRRFRSPVQGITMKARKVKSFLQQHIPGFSYLVDFRVVLTGNASKLGLAASEQPSVWTLQEAISISTPAGRQALLNRTILHSQKAFALEADFERITLNPKMFGPLEAEWGGYRVVDEDFVLHPDKIWHEHRAEQISDPRFKALVRIWAFDKLPAGLNSPERRRFIAGREMRAIGRLHQLGSPLVERNAILAPVGEEKNEILTQHFELRRLTAGLTTLDRYLERASEDLDVGDRITTAAGIMEIVAELHAQGIAHRDLGPRSVWAASPTRVALGGLMTCQLPDEESLGDWSSVLRGHAVTLPEDTDRALAGTAKQRDVYALGRLAFHILTGSAPPSDAASAAAMLPVALPDLMAWFARAIARDAPSRFSDARIMADGFAAVVDRSQADDVDQTLIDRYETSDSPYFLWPVKRKLKGTTVYVSLSEDNEEIVIKTWPRIRRGTSAATDVAMTRLFDGVGRLVSSPLPGLPRYLRTGLSETGPFVAYKFELGTPINEALPADIERAARLSNKLVQCVLAIHAMGHSHGDVAPKNIIVCDDGNDIRLLDLFDIADVGDGRVRTPAMCPENCDALTDQQLDRYATTKIVRDVLANLSDGSLATDLEELDRELDRPRLETLDPVTAVLRNIIQRIEAERPPKMAVSFRGAGSEPFTADGGRYYAQTERVDSTTIEYRLFGIERELTFQLRGAEITHVRYVPANFTRLSYASQHGVPVNLQIVLTDGADSGLEELLAFVTPLVGLQFAAPDGERDGKAPTLDVPRYWRKLLELEASLQPEVEIFQDIGPPRGPVAVYAYERQGQDFDFDAGTTVEVRLPNGRKVGEVNLEQTDAQRLVVEYSDRRLVPGDRVNLVDRRSRSSFDRRTKAVDRILDDEAAIPGLIGYFETERAINTTNFGDEVSESALERYKLNRGQRRAFRHVIGHGPVGLLQGPPGTGKTHFIASLVHWLTTEKGARKILIASQSHEAVNNAIEALLDLFKKLGGRRPSLLRIGSKGITEKIRPYHTASLQERFQSRFENAFRYRVGGLGSAIGLKRGLVADAVDIDRNLGERVRRLKTLAEAEKGSASVSRAERTRRDATVRTAAAAFSSAAAKILGRSADASQIDAELEAAFATLLVRHPDTSPSDLTKVRQLIELSREWSASLASPYRNFEEFLAKTRTIVTATCVGVGQTKIRMEKSTYDWVIVDEAARCTPGELAVPIQLGRRVLLVGDHRQLLPMTERAVLKGLSAEMPETPRVEFERSDFERAYLSRYGQDNGRTLTEQYRMAPEICDLVSKVFYEPHGVKLQTSDDRESDPAFARAFPASLAAPVTWIDTSDEPDHVEKPASWDETTFSNEAEVDAVMRLLEIIAADIALVEALLASKSETPIGIICMYSAQKARIEEVFSRRPWDVRFRSMVRIDTVDSYQGKENTIVIVSLVRCNSRGDQGHVRIPNRCNVALSRAKERLFIVGARSMWGGVQKRWPMRKVLDEIDAGPATLAVLKVGEIR
ncbi:AAA domain-containing protein [Bradyrhizobium brasilense]|uniref:AAA domain-containing protein n=1 Tax=Bradyrhizobium brasilense TaxID=1419277 RepID=UPI001F294756|nr:AAA domain-containing protein [Bradyrhizobium brasilense]